jgi:hypothetical protein
MATPDNNDDISKINDENVYAETTRAMNTARNFIVTGTFTVFALTALGAGLGAFFGSPDAWKQLSPVVDTLLAGELAVLGTVVAFYMSR